jgi:hypothetical protein
MNIRDYAIAPINAFTIFIPEQQEAIASLSSQGKGRVMRIASRRSFFVVACFVSVLAGCSGSNEYETTRVSGVVTCRGKAVANATVNFTPVPDPSRPSGNRGRVALGLTDQDGRFTLTTYQDGDGAIVGKHIVTVGLNMDESTGRVQAFACNDSTKEVTVDRGTSEYQIEF